MAFHRQEVAAAKEMLKRAAAVSVLPFCSLAPPPASAATTETDGEERKFTAVTELIERVERSTQDGTDPIDRLVDDIKATMLSASEPYVLIGVLLEGIVQTVLRQLPEPERRDTAFGLIGLLCDRLNLQSPGPS